MLGGIAMPDGLSYPQCVTQLKDIEKDVLDEACVLAQNRAFYAALRNRDVELMGQVWSMCAQVSCIHPGWQPLHGREMVMASWETILQHTNLPAIYPQAASVKLFGDTALVICEESYKEGSLVATNVFVRESDDWRLLHHQAGPLNPAADLDDDDTLFDDGDPDSLLDPEDAELANQSGEHSALTPEALDEAEAQVGAHSSGDELLALYVPRRGPRRFVN